MPRRNSTFASQHCRLLPPPMFASQFASKRERKRMTSGIAAEDWIAHHARFAPRAEAAHDLASDRRFTYAAFDDRITRAALWLAPAFGVSRGGRGAGLRIYDTHLFDVPFPLPRVGAL